jgi:sensor histidine kinase YesM
MTRELSHQQGFWRTYFGDKRGIVALIVVCFSIALFTNLVTSVGLGINMLFSLGYGLPISMLETFFRTRKKPLRDVFINIISVSVGCMLGTTLVYTYLVASGIMPFGFVGSTLFYNYGFGFFFSTIGFYFFWSRYQNQTLTLELKKQQLKVAEARNLHQQAENRLLQSQMEPHFLFNTLANIQTLIDIDTVSAKKTIADLSKMLRAALNNTTKNECTLAEEMDIVRAYLSIQKIRMGDRFHVVETIDERSIHCSIPPMIIQPLVENSIKHGVERAMGNCTIFIETQCNEQSLVLTVSDHCESRQNQSSQSSSYQKAKNPMVELNESTGHGISLNNINKRLAIRYGGAATLVQHENESGWVTVVTLPLPVTASTLAAPVTKG